MEVTLDKFGRILIPKEIRKVLGLQAGQVLSLYTSEENNLICIQPKIEEAESPIRYTDMGIPYIDNGQASEDELDTSQLVQETRAHYLNRKLGLE